MQLSLNPALDGPQLHRIVDAVAVQVVPAVGHRLRVRRAAAPGGAGGVCGAARRPRRGGAGRPGSPHCCRAWVIRRWRGATAAWLARRHDLIAFLEAVYVEADLSEDKRVKALLPGVTAALKALP